MALSLGCLSWGLGEAWWTWASVRFGTVPFPSVADLGFLCFPLLAGASLLLPPVGGGRAGRWQRLLDGLMARARWVW